MQPQSNAQNYTPLPSVQQDHASVSKAPIIVMVIVLLSLAAVAIYLYALNSLRASTSPTSTTVVLPTLPGNQTALPISPTQAVSSSPQALLQEIQALDVGSPEADLKQVSQDVAGL